MKMSTVNISLPKAMDEFVRENVERDYGNVSEFFRDLLRERMRREIEADLAFLNSATDGAPAGPTDPDVKEILRIQRRVRKKLRARGV
jgi:Arc/MetJ-type ribon-helix-helix transcriptional regulator